MNSHPGSGNAGPLARIATAIVFFVLGFMLASWITHIPTIKNQLGITSSQLGLALLGIAVGSLLSTSIVGIFIERWGSRKVTVVGSLLGTVMMMMPVLMPGYLPLVIAFVALGAANGTGVVAMNAQGLTVENRMGRIIMSSLHAMFSIGGLIGSLFAIALLKAGVSPLAHILTAGAIGLVLVLASKRFLLPDRATAETIKSGAGRSYFSPQKNLLLLGMLTFVTLMTEGAIADWSALYLHQQLEIKAEMAALGYAGFSLAMAVGRLAGDRLATLFGRSTLLQTGGALAACGFIMLVLAEHYLLAVGGFICMGLGISNVIPLLYSTAGNMKNTRPGVGIATVSATGHLGFLVGPPLVGFLADWISLTYALGIFAVFMAFVASMGKWVERQTGTQ
jgi:MFS family permease